LNSRKGGREDKMPFQDTQPSLTGYLIQWNLNQVVKTKLFGGRYLSLWDYFATLGFQYESGAILGRAKRDKINTLVNILVVPGTEINGFIKAFQDAAKARLDTFIDEAGKEPDTFDDFIAMRALRKLGCFEEPGQGLKALKKVGKQKVPFKKVWADVQTYGTEGIMFGSSFPELTEKMHKNANEHIDMEGWSEARKYGLDIPEKPDTQSLEEREAWVLGLAAVYVAEFWPEFLDSLDLKDYMGET
jgi:hypothetical protein